MQHTFRVYCFLPVILLFVATHMTSCEKLVDIPAPQTELVSASVFSSNATANAAVTAIYSQMINQSVPFMIPFLTGISGDELTGYSTFPDFVSFYTNSLTALNGSLTTIWTPAYSYIYQANAAIDGLQGSTTVSPAVRKQLLAEAKFVRAFWLFYLTSLYGDVPALTTSDYTVTSVAARMPQAQVYQQIVSDLKDCEAQLNQNFVDATDTATTTERTRPTSWAASALLARVYLTLRDWTDAESEASVVIQHAPMFQLVSDLTGVFLKNSSEAIWQLQPKTSANTPEGADFILTTPPSNTNNSFAQSTTLSPQLLNAFEPGDNRSTAWVGSYGGFSFPYKYKAAASATVTTEYEMVLRLAEQYLIRSEARAQQGDTAGAALDLNVIRSRAGLGGVTYTTTASLLTAIYHERQVELFTEWGQRWLDLKRTGLIDGVMGNPGGVCAAKGGTWASYQQLYPIPQTERDNDPNLTQNSGY